MSIREVQMESFMRHSKAIKDKMIRQTAQAQKAANNFKKLKLESKARNKRTKNFNPMMNRASAAFKKLAIAQRRSSPSGPYFAPKKLNTNRTKYTKIAKKLEKKLEKIETKLQNRPLDRSFILKQLQILTTEIKFTKEEFAIDLHNRISSGINQNNGNFYYNENTPLVNVSQLNKNISTANIIMYTEIIKTIKNNNLKKTTEFPKIKNMDAVLMSYNTRLRSYNTVPKPVNNNGSSYQTPNVTQQPNNEVELPPQERNTEINEQLSAMEQELNRRSNKNKKNAVTRARQKQPNNEPFNRGNYQLLPGPSRLNRAKNYFKKRQNKAAVQAQQNNINAAKFQRNINNLKKNVFN